MSDKLVRIEDVWAEEDLGMEYENWEDDYENENCEGFYDPASETCNLCPNDELCGYEFEEDMKEKEASGLRVEEENKNE